jgi:NAD(P)-dependent dehydrogenase (short-subunit alcohol dehydrogenase family)
VLFDVNIKGVFYSMKYEIEQMLKTGGGSIVNTSSIFGLNGFPGWSLYVATKHAVTGMTKTAALDCSFLPKRCNLQPSTQTAMSGKATRRTPHTRPIIVKVSTIDAGPRSAEVMMKASSGPSPAPWRFRGIASGTVVIAHPGKVAPAKAAPGTDCAT